MNKISFAILLFIVLLSACSESVKTKSGIEVSYLRKNNAGALVNNTILSYNIRYNNENGKELFNTATRNGAVTIQYSDSIWKDMGFLYEALFLCEVGDSITFEIPAEDLYKKTFKMELPDSIKKDSKIKFYVGLESAMTNEEFQAFQKEKYEKEMEKREKETKERMDLEVEIINKYLEANNIQALTTESGLRYVITQAGSGENAKAGQNIVVHYHGTLLNGTKFDSSYDRNEPYEFKLGYGRVIRGWDEGFALLNKGTKATLYIPSNLAYGTQARNEIIKENSILKFDVEIMDIK